MVRRYIILLLVSVVLMASDRVVGFNFARDILQVPLSPISYGLYQVGYNVRGMANFIYNIPIVYRENARLTERLITLEEDLITLNNVRDENKSLRSQLNVLGERASKSILAHVIGVDSSGESIRLILNQGERDGLRKDMIAVNGNTLIGRVTDVRWAHAYVLPIFGTESKVPVRVVRDGEGESVKGLLTGEYNTRLLLTEVLQRFELNQGDLIVTSGEGGVYPAGLLAGRIGEVISQDNELFKSAYVNPIWDIDTLQVVFIEVD